MNKARANELRKDWIKHNIQQETSIEDQKERFSASACSQVCCCNNCYYWNNIKECTKEINLTGVSDYYSMNYKINPCKRVEL